jgi:REP element-mobilizing transposase RayT
MASAGLRGAVVSAIARCAAESEWELAAFSIEETHMHALLTYNTRSIESTLKWLAQETTKAVHRETSHNGPVWCKGRWRQFIFDESHWWNTIQYIERHNLRLGLPARPYDFIVGQ